MSALPNVPNPMAKMTVDEFLDWSSGVDGRHELENGEIIVLPAERVEYAEATFQVQQRLSRALAAAGASCRVLPDGSTVRIDAETVFEPDAMVHCGKRLPHGPKDTKNPIIVVEVSSPATAARDETTKVIGYFGLPSVRHYLVICPEQDRNLHFVRVGGSIVASTVTGSKITMSPPGITISVDHLLD